MAHFALTAEQGVRGIIMSQLNVNISRSMLTDTSIPLSFIIIFYTI